VARLVGDEGMFVPSTDASGDARPPRRRAGVPELGDTASREPGTLSFKRAVASPLTPTLRSDSPLLRELDAQTERDITRCVRVCPADAHLFFEREIAAALEAALREKTIAAIEIHATRIGRPQFTRFRPLLPAQVTQAVCRVLEVDRDSALTYQRLSMLCGDSLRALLDADTTDPRREQLALALGVEHAEMLRPERHETLVRAVSQFILDCDHLTRFLIVLHMYEQR
jgi:ferredoxin